MREAEAHASEDKKKQEVIEARNHADSLIYGTEKSLNDLGDKADAGLKADLEGKIANLRKLMEGDDAAAIKAATEELAKASHKLAEQLYPAAGRRAARRRRRLRRRFLRRQCRRFRQWRRRRGGCRLYGSEKVNLPTHERQRLCQRRASARLFSSLPPIPFAPAPAVLPSADRSQRKACLMLPPRIILDGNSHPSGGNMNKMLLFSLLSSAFLLAGGCVVGPCYP